MYVADHYYVEIVDKLIGDSNTGCMQIKFEFEIMTTKVRKFELCLTKK